MDEVFGVFGIFYVVYMLFMLAITVGTYVMQSYSLYTISRRRGINHAWLSWVPIGSSWIMGCISDQYRYVAKGQVKNKRKAILVLQILMWACYIVFFVLFGMLIVNGVVEGEFAPDYSPDVRGLIGISVGMLATGLAMMSFAIALLVLQYMALYDLYASCEPGNEVLYLVLGIFFSILQIIFLFICRNKDGGMPPRKVEPVCIDSPQEPWEN